MSSMRTLSWAAALALAGCTSEKPVPEYTRSSGSLAISPDDKLAFAADADNGALAVVDLQSQALVATVKVGSRPEFVTTGKSGEVYVSNRGSRSVSVVRKSVLGWQVIGEAQVGAEPTGLAVSPDGKLLAVANSSSGTVSLVDTSSLATVGSVEVGGAPRAVSFRPGGALYVAGYEGSLRVVSVEELAVAREVSLRVEFQNPSSAVDRRAPDHVTAVAVAPDGQRAYVVHAQCKDDEIVPPPSAGYYDTSPGLPNLVAPAVTTLEVESDRRFQIDPTDGRGMDEEQGEFPPPMLKAGSLPVVAMPSAAVVAPGGRWLIMASIASDNVTVFDTERRQDDDYQDPGQGVYGVVPVGAGPTGVAVSADGKVAYVHNSFDHTVSVLGQVNAARMEETGRIEIGKSPLSEAQENGRRLFFSARDPRMTSQTTGLACASCHGDGGRADGLTWKFPSGARNTPTLAYKELMSTAPFHWDGALQNLEAFQQIITGRMGGNGLSSAEFGDLAAYLAVLPEPDNPHRGPELTAEQTLGKQLFEDPRKGNCASCHAGPAFTDNQVKTVGGGDTKQVHVPGSDSMPQIATPPLRNVFATAPYRHDGSARNLRELFTTDGNKVREMDLRGKLSDAEIDALVAYLETL